MKLADNILHHIEAGAKGIWVTSYEEERVLEQLKDVFDQFRARWHWSSVQNLTDAVHDDAPLQFKYDPKRGLVDIFEHVHTSLKKGLFVMFDAHHAFAAGPDTALNVRALKEFI